MLQVSDYNYLGKFYKKNFIKISKKKYHKKKILSASDKKNLQNLNTNGFCILRGVFQKKFINEINLEFPKQDVINLFSKGAGNVIPRLKQQYNIDFNVPLDVEMKIGYNWLKLNEVKL